MTVKSYPVPVDLYSKEEAPFVYTQYGQEFAAARHNLEPRTAGTIACFACGPLKDGPTAQAWLKAGYIKRRED